jgi:hypothetical protein
MAEEKIVMIHVQYGTGCKPCYYDLRNTTTGEQVSCKFPNHEPKCSRWHEGNGGREGIYLTEDNAALARLRGTYS